MQRILTGSPFWASDGDFISVGCDSAADGYCAIRKEPKNMFVITFPLKQYFLNINRFMAISFLRRWITDEFSFLYLTHPADDPNVTFVADEAGFGSNGTADYLEHDTSDEINIKIFCI